MAEPKKNDYYSILHISPDADLREVAEAIRRMRDTDKAGNYSAIIKKIEETLTDPELRVQYDFENGYSGPKNNFVDLNEDDIKELNNKIEHHKYDVRKELEEYSVRASHNERKGTGGYGISMQKIIMLAVVVLLLLAAFVLSKPILDRMEGKKQAEAALATLKNTEKQIEDAIREHGTFPTSLALNSNDSRFSLRLDSANNRIILNFSGEVIDDLKNTEMTHTFITQPNITYWQCDIASNFPEKFKPANCY